MSNPGTPWGWVQAAVAALREHQLERPTRTYSGGVGPELHWLPHETHAPLINFGSNDYLGLAGDPRLTAAAMQSAQRHGWGSGASPVVCGTSQIHRELELRLASWLHAEDCLTFSSGYAANSGTIPALVGAGDQIFSDALNHASLIDGCRLSRAELHVYKHADCADLQQRLVTTPSTGKRLIVSDTLFSMDGDVPDLHTLAALAQEHNCMLLLDEAHACGVWGAHGSGLATALLSKYPDILRTATLSKALGGSGGAVAGRQSVVTWLRHHARPYFFSTAHPPAMAGAALAAVELAQAEPWRRTHLQALSEYLIRGLQSAGMEVGSTQSQIVPVILGSNERTLAVTASLREAGFHVPGIRPPSVPQGTARLRISLTAAHHLEQVEQLIAAIVIAVRKH